FVAISFLRCCIADLLSRRGELAAAASPLWAVAMRYRGEMDHVGLKDRSTDGREQVARLCSFALRLCSVLRAVSPQFRREPPGEGRQSNGGADEQRQGGEAVENDRAGRHPERLA